MKTRTVVKKATSMVVAGGVTIIIKGIVRNAVGEDLNPVKKVQVRSAEFVLGTIVAAHVSDYTDAIIDRIADNIEQINNPATEEEPEVLTGTVIE